VAALVAISKTGRGQLRTADLGELAWLAASDEDDRSASFDELCYALSIAEATRDASAVETCLREWHTTARALSDPRAREILTGPGDEDYAEVARPEPWPGSRRLPSSRRGPPARWAPWRQARLPGARAPPFTCSCGRAPDPVGPANAQFRDHVAMAPGGPPKVGTSSIMKGKHAGPEWPGYSKTVH
jgi:hypothetical protein